MDANEAVAPLPGLNLQTARAAARPEPALARRRPRSEATRAALLTGPILPTLLRLALPTMVVLVAQTAVNIAEAYYVGFLGTDALAGVALVFPVFMLMTMMSNGGLGSGVSSAVARAIGAGRKDDADALVFHAIVLGVICRRAVYLWHDLGRPGAVPRARRPRRGARRRAEIFQLSVRRRDSGMDRQPAGRGVARLRQCPGAGHGDAGRRAGDDPGLADPDFWPWPGAAARHRRRRHRLRLYYGAAMLFLLRYMAVGARRPDLQGRAAAGAAVRRHSESRRADRRQYRADQPHRHPGHRRGRAVRHHGARGLWHRVAARLRDDPDPVRPVHGDPDHGRHQYRRRRDRARQEDRVGQRLRRAGADGRHRRSSSPLIRRSGSTCSATMPRCCARARSICASWRRPMPRSASASCIAFAAQGAGHVLWPFVASLVRILLAAGCGWLAVGHFGAGMAALAGMVAASLVAYAAICSVVMLSALASGVWTAR